MPEGATRLQIIAALLETPAPEAGADCRVLVDGRPAAPTVALSPGGRTATFDRLDVSGAREVRLVVDSGRFGDIGDLVAWGDGVFLFAAP